MDSLHSGLKIVPMREDHIAALSRIERLCFTTPWSENAIREELSNPPAAFFVAELSGVPAGYAGMHHILDEGYILNVAVHPDFRRGGIASALLERLYRYGAENGLSFLTLEVRVSNFAAREAYRKAGYEKAGVRRNFYENPREDAILMTRRIKTEKETVIKP